MTTDIQIVRESIGRIVGMLTHQRIKVTQQGTRAYVAYNKKTQAIERVNVPYLPDSSTPEFVSAVQGFLDHEVGHVLHSDPAVLVKANKLGKRVANLHNIVEDVYVERKMAEMFAGSGYNLENVRRFYLEKIAGPKIAEALAAGDKLKAEGYATVVAFRAWGGQTAAVDFMKANNLDPLVKDVFEKLGPELRAKIGKCKNSKDCLDLARDYLGKLEEVKPKAPPPPPPPKPAPPPPPPLEPEPEEDEGEDPLEGVETEPAAAISEPEPEPEPEESAAEPTEPGEEPTEEPGSTGASEDPAPGEDGDEGEEGTGGEDPSGDDEHGAEPGDDDATTPGSEPTPPSEPEGTGDEGDEGAPTGAEDDEGTGSGAGSVSGDDDDDGAPEDGEAGEPGEGPSSGGSPSGEEGAGAEDPTGEKSTASGAEDDDSEEAAERLASMFDENRDFDHAMGEELSKAAREEHLASDYRIFTTDFDVIEKAPLAAHAGSVKKMVDTVTPMIGVMQNQLTRAIAAQSKKAWMPGQRRGRISAGALSRVATGDDRIFRKRIETKWIETAVTNVVDCSYSMVSEDKIVKAGLAAYAVAATLERIKVKSELIGFTTRENPELMAAMQADKLMEIDEYGRWEALYLPVFKDFNERLGTEAESRMAHLTEIPRSWMRENVDGECLQLIARRLMAQRVERRIMIVWSDGRPACPPATGINEHLERCVREITRLGIEVFAIGIGTGVVRRFYGDERSIVLTNVAELPVVVMSQLCKMLLS